MKGAFLGILLLLGWYLGLYLLLVKIPPDDKFNVCDQGVVMDINSFVVTVSCGEKREIFELGNTLPHDCRPRFKRESGKIVFYGECADAKAEDMVFRDWMKQQLSR